MRASGNVVVALNAVKRKQNADSDKQSEKKSISRNAASEDLQRTVFYWVPPTSKIAKTHQTISSREVVTSHGVPRKHVKAYLRKEIEEAEACKSLPFTLLLVISYAVMAVSHDNAATVRAVEDSLELDVRENANFAYTNYAGHKNIDNVNSHTDFYTWMREGFLPLFFTHESSFHEGYNASDPRYVAAMQNWSLNERGYWLGYNRIVGGIRLVQERSEEGECTTLRELHALYKLPCVGGLDYNLNPELGLPNERAQTTIAPEREVWLFIYEDQDVVQAIVQKLQEDNWLDRQTKKIEIAMPVYNAEFGIHTLVRVNFYFSRGGHVWKHIIPASQFADWHDKWYYGVYDSIWLLCVVYIFVIEVNEIQVVIRKKGVAAIVTEYISFYNFVDWLTVLGGAAIVIVFVNSIGMRTELNKILSGIPAIEMPAEADYYARQTNEYLKYLEMNVNYVRYLRRALCFYPLIIVIRLFKAFSAQPRLAVVTNTMIKAGPDLLHFMIVFGSVFLTFTICGIVLFGREVSSFTTFSRAMVATFRTMLGDIEWDELSAIGRLWAGVWLWLFIIIVVQLMLNMVLAIVMDHYEEAKSSAGSSETLLDEAMQFYERWMGERRGTHVPLEAVLEALLRDERKASRKQRPTLGTQLSWFLGTLQENVADGEDDDLDAEDAHADASNAHSRRHRHEAVEEGDEEELLTATKLMEIQATSELKHNSLSEVQADELLEAACINFYTVYKEPSTVEELLHLAQRVSMRLPKLTTLTKKALEVQDTGPAEELRWFAQEVDTYITDVSREREARQAKIDEMVALRDRLRERLERVAAHHRSPHTSPERAPARSPEHPPSLQMGAAAAAPAAGATSQAAGQARQDSK
eukprot:TRINITY_DN13937_c0_g1_i1.p1 TRINITY_DN13937_c0_g1~~TRINITY_DN13937_c0_g1_i1.p1  ORF type:complete len:865 (+),score=196.33 TRINITY_DN13937_c0_g1_i1:276-2870(+)